MAQMHGMPHHERERPTRHMVPVLFLPLEDACKEKSQMQNLCWIPALLPTYRPTLGASHLH